jgi:hypothetical protein
VLCGTGVAGVAVSSPTLSAKNAERVGHPELYVVRARSFADLRPFRMMVGLGGGAPVPCYACFVGTGVGG